MAHKKCLICRFRQAKDDQCLRLSKPCKDAQHDELFDACGVSQCGPWEVERPKEKEKKKRIAKADRDMA